MKHCVQHVYRGTQSLEAGHVLTQQPCCQSSRPITLGMTFKVGRRRWTKCPYLLRLSPAVLSPCAAFADECVCVCDFGQTWSGIRTAVTFPTCHMRHRGDARGQGIGEHKDGHKEKRVCVCIYVWKSNEHGRCVVVATWKSLTWRHPLTLMSTQMYVLFTLFLKTSPWALESYSLRARSKYWAQRRTATAAGCPPCLAVLRVRPFQCSLLTDEEASSLRFCLWLVEERLFLFLLN